MIECSLFFHNWFLHGIDWFFTWNWYKIDWLLVFSDKIGKNRLFLIDICLSYTRPLSWTVALIVFDWFPFNRGEYLITTGICLTDWRVLCAYIVHYSLYGERMVVNSVETDHFTSAHEFWWAATFVNHFVNSAQFQSGLLWPYMFGFCAFFIVVGGYLFKVIHLEYLCVVILCFLEVKKRWNTLQVWFTYRLSITKKGRFR